MMLGNTVSGTMGLAAGLLFLVSLAHSILGEREILRPLFAAKHWRLPGIPRRPAEVLLRFAWHATTVAWWGLCASLLDVSPVRAFAGVCLASALVLFVVLRGHLAWPLFLFAGLAALWGNGDLGANATGLAVGLAAVVASGAAALHLYWALGGRWGMANAVPRRADGTPTMNPGALACGAVAALLLIFVGLLWAARFGPALPDGFVASAIPWALGAAALLLALRAVGDTRQVGFSKADHSTAFARADDALYSPLVVVMLTGTVAAWLTFS